MPLSSLPAGMGLSWVAADSFQGLPPLELLTGKDAAPVVSVLTGASAPEAGSTGGRGTSFWTFCVDLVAAEFHREPVKNTCDLFKSCFLDLTLYFENNPGGMVHLA